MGILNAQHLAPAAGFFEPQRKYNWSLEVALDDAGDQVIIMQSLDTCSAIHETSEETVLEHAGERRYVAGKVSYTELTLTLKDFVDIGTATAVLKWRRQVYNPESGSIGLARQYKKNADFTMFSPDQSVVRIYKLIGVWPKAINMGDYSMADNGYVPLSVTLRFDRAVPGAGLNSGLGGINIGVLTPPL